ncbi:metal ABC transporter substrate-binding protein [Actinomadura macrotermitis]|uniref:High-affinity zinc uptake system binding-protein ZnuA n=1 Tax=Actinomadura macrotermitis TaxID=2585200 RepID=A0A7K0BNE4_9ACTN|nr:High-affinity zinc uptake system binding-protein ZnuA [Actinomadura macrotermitis]
MLTLRGTPRLLPAAAFAVAGLTALSACGDAGADGAGGKTKVVASFYPMAWLSQEVGGADVTVQTLTKPGAEPHDLELTPRQIGDVGKARLTVYVKGVQPAVDQAVAKEAKGRALDAATTVKTLPAPHGGEEEEEGHEHAEVSYDPHLWLDPSRMAAVAKALGDRLAAADPAHAAGYRTRAAALAGRLAELDKAFQDGLKTCKHKTIVTAHAAFGYLADRYGLTQVPIAGVDAASEPSPKRLGELTRQVRAAGATTVFTETLVSPKVAESLAREAGVKTAVLDPVEGIKKGAGGDYQTVMRADLGTLRSALECS